jgi:uncharacterized protein YprB with RNaseH-like and TPR domain
MGKSLKESLKIIRARARAIRQRRESPELVEDLIEAGAVARGTSNVGEGGARRPAGEGEARQPVGETEDVDIAVVLEKYKGGDIGPIEAIETGVECASGGDPFFLIRRGGLDIDPAAPVEAETFARLSEWPDVVGARAHGAQAAGDRTDVRFNRDSVCFLDIETTGLSPTTYLFLIGMMFWEKGGFVAELAFARNYAEEAAVLRYVRDTLRHFDVVVTYNGDRFDLPFIETRLAATLVGPLDPIASVDLLYAARRVFRGVLPNCKLGTVERHIRGVERSGDIPGRYIPQAYHDYVRSGDARAMKNVLYHNRMDLFTMAILLNRLAFA